jgi:tRNA dimethylallyltransferase
MRALEVIYASGETFSGFRQRNAAARDFNIVTLGLHWERDELYQRINSRTDAMIQEGLEKEARQFEAFRNQYALRTVGYTEFFDYLDGKQDLKTTISLIKQHTRNFAKRQLTWFKKDVNTKWIDAKDEKAIFAFINSIHH